MEKTLNELIKSLIKLKTQYPELENQPVFFLNEETKEYLSIFNNPSKIVIDDEEFGLIN